MLKLLKIITLTYLLLALLQACSSDLVPDPQDCEALPSLQLVSVTDADWGSFFSTKRAEARAAEASGLFRIGGQTEQNEGEFSKGGAGSYTLKLVDANGNS